MGRDGPGVADLAIQPGGKTRLAGSAQGAGVWKPVNSTSAPFDTRQSIRLNINAFSLQDNGTVCVAEVGSLKVKWSRRLPAAPTSLTVIKDTLGRHSVSFVVDTEPEYMPDPHTGIDLDPGRFAALSDGTKTDSPRFFLRRAGKKLRKMQKTLSRKARDSNNRAKSRSDSGHLTYSRPLTRTRSGPGPDVFSHMIIQCCTQSVA